MRRVRKYIYIIYSTFFWFFNDYMYVQLRPCYGHVQQFEIIHVIIHLFKIGSKISSHFMQNGSPFLEKDSFEFILRMSNQARIDILTLTKTEVKRRKWRFLLQHCLGFQREIKQADLRSCSCFRSFHLHFCSTCISSLQKWSLWKAGIETQHVNNLDLYMYMYLHVHV